MSNYFIGDIHGCYNEFYKILQKVNFNQLTDTLWITGDLVAKGCDSLKVLRLVYSLRHCVRLVLGNHDLNLLAIAAGVNCTKPEDKLEELLKAPDFKVLINWLRTQPLLQIDQKKNIIMVHAGIIPQWNVSILIKCANKIKNILRSKKYNFFLKKFYNIPFLKWNTNSNILNTAIFSAHVFTRIRYCFLNGTLELNCKENPIKAPKNLIPWFYLLKTNIKKYNIIFGHWSTLMQIQISKNIYAIDTGCCWGKFLTLLRWEDKLVISLPANKS